LPRRYAPRNDGGMDSCFRRNDIKEKGEETRRMDSRLRGCVATNYIEQ